jgi:hypothetical protein
MSLLWSWREGPRKTLAASLGRWFDAPMEHGASEEHTESVARPRHSLLRALFLVALVPVVAIVCTVYVRMHPLVFNESFWGHRHCISAAIIQLRMYALDHDGHLPAHTNGYGDALLLLVSNVPGVAECVTGPGYSGQVFLEAARTNGHVPEAACGRVYVQGLSNKDDGRIVVLFDKLPTPGGDHCNGFRRLKCRLCREVVMLDGSNLTIAESQWFAFASNQIQFLVEAGIPRKEAARLYASKP